MNLHASISVDLDDLWAYQRTLGYAEWERMDSYLHLAVPRMLEAFDAAACRVTVFIVGADAARADARELLGPIAARGHEVGNHSYSHACWLHRSDRETIRAELELAHQAVVQATGQHPIGYRGPGFTWSTASLAAVADLGYRFDASSLPSLVGPLARRRLLAGRRFSHADRVLRSDIFGKLRDGVRPNRPYRWCVPDGRRLLEIPVTTIPGLRVPFHQSYLCFLASFSPRVARGYLRAGLAACRAARVEPTLLFHPLDWLSADEVPGLGSFPAMSLGLRDKMALLADTIEAVKSHFELETMGAQAARLADAQLAEHRSVARADRAMRSSSLDAVPVRGESR